MAPKNTIISGKDMKSIASGGGPLICVEFDIADRWLGVTGSAFPCGSQEKKLTDYARACAVKDYLGKVSLGDRDALILGDMPIETQIWNTFDGLSGILRVYYADPGVDVRNMLESTGEINLEDPDEVLPFEVMSTPFIVFDSAYPGSGANIDLLSLEVLPGKYMVKTKQLQLDERTSVLVHLFVPSWT